MNEEEGRETFRGSPAPAPCNPYYGTFQGVANYYQPPPHPVVGFPQPVPPHRYPVPCYSHGYQTIATGYAVAEVRPLRDSGRLPCCGLGMGWFLFMIGFFIGGIPWYVGTFFLLFTRVDYREKPGYVACAVASFLAILALTFGVTRGSHQHHHHSY